MTEAYAELVAELRYLGTRIEKVAGAVDGGIELEEIDLEWGNHIIERIEMLRKSWRLALDKVAALGG